MSTTYVGEVACPACAASVAVNLAESANAQRAPELRQAILRGALHVGRCTACGETFQVERDLLYSDLPKGVLIGCFPSSRRGERVALERQVVQTWVQTIEVEAPPAVRATFQGPGPRVVFGLARLREKLVCFDSALDDRLVEAVKLALLDGIEGRAAAGVTDLVLVDVVADDRLVFQPLDTRGVATGAHLLEVSRVMYDDLHRTRDNVRALLPGLFEGLWVHHTQAHRRPHAVAS